MGPQKVETQRDFFQYLETDTCLHIMGFLDDPADLVRVTAVSHFSRHFVIANGLAKKLCLKSFPRLSNVDVIVKTSEESVNLVDVASNDAILGRDHKAYASLLHAITKSKVPPKDCIEKAICASSTDHYEYEGIVNTLMNPRDGRASYWLSRGQIEPDVSETLLYKLNANIWVITEIDIQPFEVFSHSGNHIYSVNFVKFRVGHPKFHMEIEKDIKEIEKDHWRSPSPKFADDKFVWTYTSPEFPMVQENRLQPFKLPEPVLSIDGYLKIELLDRVQRKERDGLYYICVCYVRVLGRPLYPAFDIEICEPCEKLLLKYYPEKLH